MKNHFPNHYLIVCIIICTSFSLDSKAIPYRDTTTVLPANSVQPAIVLKNYAEKNKVQYPKNLSLHKAQTMDYVQKFSEKRRDYLIRTYKTGKKFFPKITAVLKRFQLPQELRVLIALESGFNANAISPVGALGYWQIMDDVAKEYGLHIIPANKTATVNITSPVKGKKKDRDDRTNFTKSTLTAAKYLHDRCRNLNNDLLLMVASYNWGVGNVWQAMKKTGKTNPGFWDIKKYLPAETKAYVMNFITLNVIFNNYDTFLKNQLVFTNDVEEEVQTARLNVIADSNSVTSN